MRFYVCLTRSSLWTVLAVPPSCREADTVQKIFHLSPASRTFVRLFYLTLSGCCHPVLLPVWSHRDSQGQPLSRPASPASWQRLSSNVRLAPSQQRSL